MSHASILVASTREVPKAARAHRARGLAEPRNCAARADRVASRLAPLAATPRSVLAVLAAWILYPWRFDRSA